MIHEPRAGCRWHIIERKGGKPGAREFLQAGESYCVAASARFLQHEGAPDQGWSLHDGEGNMIALLIQSMGSLFPVFNGEKDIQLPGFICRFLQNRGVHAVQGLQRDAVLLEQALAPLGIIPVEQINYDLMTLDREPKSGSLKAGPPRLILRRPTPSDREALFFLQAAYEQEEVLPRGVEFNPAVCRLSLEHILSHEQVLLAELDGSVLGKINTSAVSFSRYQIGGVYVHPRFRGLGIASRMIAVFVRDILWSGKGLTLFVKKGNRAAHTAYVRVGFQVIEDYRISYY